MQETGSLRERRRAQTTGEIRLAALDLCNKLGIDQVTTDLISATAGISKRTFFNYFANKEAAIIGRPPRFTEEAVAQFVGSQGVFCDDLSALIAVHMELLDRDREIIVRLLPLLRENPQLHNAFGVAMAEFQDDLADILAQRMSDKSAVMVQGLSAAIIQSVTQVLRDRLSATPLSLYPN